AASTIEGAAVEAASTIETSQAPASKPSREEQAPNLGGRTHGIASVIRGLLRWFHRHRTPGPAVGPTPDDVEVRPRTSDQPMTPRPPPHQPRSGVEATFETPSTSAHPELYPPTASGKLYVGNLAYTVEDSDLEQLFSLFGTVRSAQVIKDRDTGQSKGFGFVEMGSGAEVQAAIQGLDDKEVYGRRLTVNTARPREPRAGGG